MIKGAIFDLDGTLLDSLSLWDNIGYRYLQTLGLSPKEDLREKFKSSSLYQAADYLKQEYDIPFSIDEIMNGINALAENFYNSEVMLKPNVEEFLQFLYENGVKMCVATATDRYLVNAALSRCQIDKYFSEIFTCTEIGHGKDEPVIYREALKYLAVPKSETIIFEDALYAIKTAKKDGFLVSAVFDKHINEQEEIKRISDFYIEDFLQINDFKKFASNL